jgi:phosphopentomutase
LIVLDGMGIGDKWGSMESGLLFANVVEFDQTWGHRNDIEGFYRGLTELDGALPRLASQLRVGDLMMITADDGNDATTTSTDHSGESYPSSCLASRWCL